MQSPWSVTGLAFVLGSTPWPSGKHIGRHLAVVVRFSAGKTIDKVGDEMVDGLTSFGLEVVVIRSVGTADAVTSREEVKQMIRVGDSIEGSNAVWTIDIKVLRARME